MDTIKPQCHFKKTTFANDPNNNNNNFDCLCRRDPTLDQSILDAITDGWWMFDIETGEAFLSRGFKALFGYRDDELTDKVKAWMTVIFPEDLELAHSLMQKHITDGTPYILPARYRHKDGSTKWVICRGKGIRDPDGSIRRLIGTHTDITALKEAEERLENLVNRDVLTGLPNRGAFTVTLTEALQKARENQAKVALFYIDIDNFKRINDSLGHIEGDALLKKIAKRLQHLCRENYYLARLGGDEFVVIISNVNDVDEVTAMAKTLITEIERPITLGERKLNCAVSVGIALYPNDGHSAEQLLKYADIAMYDIKASGKRGFQYFTKTLKLAHQRRDLLEQELAQAIENQELYLVYQPIVNLDNRQVFAFEALIRWKNNKVGEVEPSELIQIAEETGLIYAIGKFVFASACQQLQVWNHHFACYNIKMSVNFSILQLAQGEMDEFILATLEQCQIPAKQIMMELTETQLMENVNDTINSLNRLNQAGIDIAIDDLGTGYCSLSYLRQLPVRYLKIDKTFIAGIDKNPDEAAIFKAILEMANALKKGVIAEGVETQAQLDFLTDNNCPMGQGYYFTKPKPAALVEKWLAQQYTLINNPVAVER